MSKILITGSSGYIGRATALAALRAGFFVVGLDCKPPSFFLPNFLPAQLDLADLPAIQRLLQKELPDAVIHCAGQISVSESLRRPDFYYHQNVSCSLNLLSAMQLAGVRKLVFSSSASVYGAPGGHGPLVETSICEPLSPYGKSKLMVEQLLPDFYAAFGLKSVSLRYFNVAGSFAWNGIVCQETHQPENHLIPLLLEQIANQIPVQVFGGGLNTVDGSPVRDFVHVEDVAEANLAAVRFLGHDLAATAERFNICSGQGTTVLQVITQVENMLQKKAIIRFEKTRSGDPAELIGSGLLAKNRLGWRPSLFNVSQILATIENVKALF